MSPTQHPQPRVPLPPTPDQLRQRRDQALRSAVASPRFQRSLDKVNGDFRQAIDLHHSLIIRDSSIIWPYISYAEIALRNAICIRLEKNYGGVDWPLRGGNGSLHEILSKVGKEKLEDACYKATSNEEINPKEVPYYLAFGFWRSLVTRRYLGTIWKNGGFAQTFPGLKSNKLDTIKDVVEDVYDARNHVAHHQFLENPQLMLDQCKKLIGYCSPELFHYVQSKFQSEVSVERQ